MRVTLAALADYANQTGDGKVNIMGVFSHLHVRAFPYVLPQMYLVLISQVDPQEFDTDKTIRIQFADSNNQILVPAIEANFHIPRPEPPDERLQLSQVVGLAGIPLPAAADYEFSIFIDNRVLHTLPLYVNYRPGG